MKTASELERTVRRVVGCTVAGVAGFLLVTVALGRTVAQPEIRIVAHRSFWEVQYLDEDLTPIAIIENEIRLPSGEEMGVELTSREVIHSFWIPGLTGKRDVVPGRAATGVLRAPRVGVFRGVCADFCGARHADMSFDVIVQSPEDFRRWLSEEKAAGRVGE